MLAGDTTIHLSRGFTPGTNAIDLSINGVAQASSEWTEVDGYTLQLTTGLSADSQVEVTVTVSESATQNVEARYVVRPVAMTADNEEPPIRMEEYHAALRAWACWEALSREGRGKDIEKASVYLSEFKSFVNEFLESFVPDINSYPEVPFFV